MSTRLESAARLLVTVVGGTVVLVALVVPPCYGQAPPENAQPCVESQVLHLEPSTQVAGCEINPEQDLDSFTFDGAPGDIIRLSFSSRIAPPGFNSLSADVELRDPLNNPLPGQSCGQNCAFSIQRNLSEQGVHVVRVSDIGFNATGPYWFNFERVVPPLYAVGLPYGVFRIAPLETGVDYDRFNFWARAGTELRIFMRTTGTALEPVLYLRRSDGFSIDSWSCTGTPSCEISRDVMFDQTDTYAIEVNDGSWDETGEIELLILCLFGPCPTGYYPTDLVFTSPIAFEWSPTADIDSTFDIVKGDLGLLLATMGDYSAAVTTCLSSGNVLPFGEDLDVPDPGDGFFYLARAVSTDLGAGSYDTARSGQLSREGGRDTGSHGINASVYACSPSGPVASFRSADPTPGATTVNMTQESAAGNSVSISVNVTDTSSVYAANLTISYDPAIAAFQSYAAGSLLEQGDTAVSYQVAEHVPGNLVVGATRLGTAGTDAAGTVPLISLMFRVSAVGESGVSLTGALLNDQVPPEPIPGVLFSGGTLVGN